MSALREEAAADLRGLRKVLAADGLDEAELFVKRGRSRRFEIGPQGRIAGSAKERGWAVRAGGPRSSFLRCGSGELAPDTHWPSPDGRALLLPPSPPPATGWQAPPDLEAPLLVEAEAMALMGALERGLREELPGSRLVRAVLQDGSSEVAIVSSRGADASFRSRSASLYVHVEGPGVPSVRFEASLAERCAAGFQPLGLARRLADRLLVSAEGGAAERDRAEMVLAPPVTIAILHGLLPLLVGPQAEALARRLRDRQGRIGSPQLCLTDDGRLPQGVLTAPVDGEGMPTRRLPLVERGIYRQPLLAWSQAGSGRIASGCVRRASWRDVPEPCPTHLYLEPAPEVPATSLVGSVSRGFYLLDALAPAAVDLEGDRLQVPVCGFTLRRGGAGAPVASAVLQGGVSTFLRGVSACARDLTFRPLDGMLGAPTVLVQGLELVPAG